MIFLWRYRAFFFYLRWEPWLIVEISILGSEPVVSSSVREHASMIFNAKVVEQRLGTSVLSHHNPQASVNGDE